jgi:hypothetical protein
MPTGRTCLLAMAHLGGWGVEIDTLGASNARLDL